MHQFIESVETENYADDLLQEPKHSLVEIDEPQHQTIEDITVETIIQVREPELQPPRQETSSQPKQLMSRDSPIKMVDIYKWQAQFEKFVINEIEGHNKPDADDKISIDTLDLKQMYGVIVKKYDTFRGGTESLIFDASAIIFEESDDKTIEEIMFGAQTATQSQHMHQDNMNDNPNSGVKHKTQKSVKIQIEEDKVIKAHVTHWQELYNHIKVQHRQEQMTLIHIICESSKSAEDQDHNFRHGAMIEPRQPDSRK